MEDFWGQPNEHNPTYPQALRLFVRYYANSKVIPEIRRLASDQASLERRWHARRSEMEKNGADASKLSDFDRRIHIQASRFAENMNKKLGKDLDLPLFRETADSPTLNEDRAKFMAFLADFVNFNHSN